MIEKLDGIIISETNYSETSKILNVLTLKYGLIGVIAKGCRSLKSELLSSTEKLTFGTFNLYYKEGKLSNLISVDIKNRFKNIKRDIMKISYASFLLDLTNQVVKQSQNSLYELLISALIKIEEGYDETVISNIIELKYLDYLGVLPIIDSCALCGSTKTIVTLSSDIGGYLCRKCRKNEPIVNEMTIKYIRMFYYVDINKISKLKLDDNIKKEINYFLDRYYDKYTGLYLKSKSFIKNLENL